jgi:hypothetical protein
MACFQQDKCLGGINDGFAAKHDPDPARSRFKFHIICEWIHTLALSFEGFRSTGFGLWTL